MKPSEIATAVRFNYGLREPIMIKGPPGVGKSETVRQAAADLGIGLADVRAVLLDPVDVRGLPVVKDGKADWCPPAFWPHDMASAGILFLDELPNAPASVQSALLQLTLERRVGDYVLPPGWSIVAAGNRETDRAGAGRLISSLSDRFTHFDYETDINDWCLWGVDHDVTPEIMAFLRFREELLHKFDPAKPSSPTPRSWVKVSNALKAGVPPEIEVAQIEGKVGKAAALEFVGFLRTFRDLPSADAVIMSPKTERVPEGPAALYGIASVLAKRATTGNLENVVTYLERLPPEFAVLSMRDAAQRDSSLTRTKAGIRWASANAALING